LVEPGVTRLGLLAGLLLLLGCAAVQAQEPALPLPLPAGAVTEAVSVPGPEGVTLRALLIRPETVTAAPVIALHGCNGLGPAERPMRLGARERDWAARLAAAGHPVLFPDSFGSRGLGQACGLAGFPAGAFTLRPGDALAAADWARAQPWGGAQRPVLLGWSHGGGAVLAARAVAVEGQIGGAIAFYPGCLGAPSGGTAPLLMLLGESDDWTPAVNCEGWLGRNPGVSRIAYLGAHHGFDGLSDLLRSRTLPNQRVVHFGGDPAARADARVRVSAFLAALP
jgi:dienelactone hydrolase